MMPDPALLTALRDTLQRLEATAATDRAPGLLALKRQILLTLADFELRDQNARTPARTSSRTQQ